MPRQNEFRHQVYSPEVIGNPWYRRLSTELPHPGAGAELHSRLGVGRVILVHGTFVGDDPLGVSETFRAFASEIPFAAAQLNSLADALQQRMKPLTDSLLRDVGNFTPEFRSLFQSLVGDDPSIELLTPAWSSQNHHLARAELAVRIVADLIQRPLSGNGRVLLWGHSHAGNAFALVTNLLANNPTAVDQFFAACGHPAGETWQLVRESLRAAQGPHPIARRLDIVTFETPVRYGWDTNGVSRLVHVCFHRVHDATQPHRAKPLFPLYPPTEVFSAAWGDWVQTFAIAGTDTPTMPTRAIHASLSDFLESSLPEPVHGIDTRFIPSKRIRNTCVRWKAGARCHADGLNVLVDYEPSGVISSGGIPIEKSMFGHGVATVSAWLPAHLRLVIQALSDTPLAAP